MTPFGAAVLAIIIVIIIVHINCLKITTADQVLCYYFIMIGIVDIFLNHIHDRVLA